MPRSATCDSFQVSPTIETYMHEIQGDALLTAEQERELSRAIKAGDSQAKSRLIRANLRLVVKIAFDYVGRGLSLEDLVGEGNLGLIRATEEFDVRFGTRFSTYAAYWIRQAIRHALVNTTTPIRLPAHMVVILTRWRRAERSLMRRDGVMPSSEEVANELGLTTAQRGMVEHALRARRLGQEGVEGTGWSVDEACDPHDGPESGLETSEEWQELEARLRGLEARERTVVVLRFGLQGHSPMTLKEIGRRMGVTREWVRKIELRAIRKLQEGSTGRALEAAGARREPLLGVA